MGAEAEVAGTRVCERWVSLERMGTRKEGDSRKEGVVISYTGALSLIWRHLAYLGLPIIG